MGRYDHHALDELIHSRIRLAALSLLVGLDEADFTHLRDQVETTDGNLTTHMRRLEEAGLVEKIKHRTGSRPITTYKITDEGRRAFADYVERLERMLPR